MIIRGTHLTRGKCGKFPLEPMVRRLITMAIILAAKKIKYSATKFFDIF